MSKINLLWIEFFKDRVYLIIIFKISGLSRDDMNVEVVDGLASFCSLLDRHGGRIATMKALEELCYVLNRKWDLKKFLHV
jgi:hypothetical protein